MLTNANSKDSVFAPLAGVVGLVVAIVVANVARLTFLGFGALLINLEGTVFLASSISFSIPPIGNGLIGKLKWAFLEFPKYGSPPSFNPIRFYLGLAFLFIAQILSVLASSQGVAR